MILGINRKVILLTFSIILIFGFALGYYIIRYQTRILKLELDERINVLMDNLSTISEYPVLIRDKESITRLTKGVMSQKDIVFCRVEDTNGNFFYEESSEDAGPVSKHSTTIVVKNYIEGIDEDLILGTSKEVTEIIGMIHLGVSHSNLNQKLYKVKMVMAVTIFITIFTTCLTIYILLKRILGRPIYQLVKATENISKGNLENKVPIGSKDEIGVLAASFNRMIDNLLETTVSKDYVENILNNMRESLLVISPSGLISTVNQNILELLGYTEDEMVNKPVDIIFEEAKDFIKWRDDVSLAKRATIRNRETFYITKDSNKIPVLFSASVMFDPEGSIQGIICVAVDITERKKAEETLLLHSKILENMNEGVNLVNASDGIIVYTNTQFNYLFGYEHDELVGRHVSVLNAPVQVTPEEKAKKIIRDLNDKGNWSGEICNIRKDGTLFWCRANVSSFNHPKFGNVWVSVHEDITKRKNVEVKLTSQEELYRTLVETIPHVIWVGNVEGKIIFMNKAWKTWTGRNIADSLGDKWTESLHPDDVEELSAKWERAFKYGESLTGECRFKTKEGSYKTISFIGTPVRDSTGKITSWIGIDMDITKRKLMEERIKDSLREKEVLLKEVHHRVKNNLQVVISLLSLQSQYVKDQNAIQMLQECQDRVNSIAIIHEKIYHSKDLSKIKLKDYIEDLANNLFISYKISTGKVRLKLDIENISLGIDISIPCGLIINELMSNSLKYAFPENRAGEVEIIIHKMSNGEIEFVFSDNGIGLPSMIDFNNSPGFGFRMIIDLVEYKLMGEIKQVQDKGTKFKIRFKEIVKNRDIEYG